MKSKTICFCIPSRRHKESIQGDSDSSSRQKSSHDKPRKGGKRRGHASTAPGDDVGSHNGAANAGGADAGMAVAMMGAAHVSTIASTDACGDGSGHGGGGDGCSWCYNESGIAFAFLVQYYCQLCLFIFPERRGGHVGFLLLFLLFLFFCFWCLWESGFCKVVGIDQEPWFCLMCDNLCNKRGCESGFILWIS